MTIGKFSLLLVLLATLSLVPSATAAIPAHLHPKRHLFENTHRQSAGVRRQASKTSYPPGYEIPSPSLLPSAWKDALQQAVSDGSIPNVPQSTLTSDGNIQYPSGSDSKAIGSWTTDKYVGPNDISDASDGIWAVSFDDGPSNESPTLYKYLTSVNQSATHFLIGSNIQAWSDAFNELATGSGDQQLAVHTWSHSLQTALSNEQILGELAWTMQIIYDQTGKIPNLWRPPQGDIDNRVRAIAEKVLGLQCALWVADSNDWCLDDNYKSECGSDNTIGQSYDSVLNYITTHVNGSTSPGVIMLEHEIRSPSFSLFGAYYPTLRNHGWTPEPIGNFDKAKAWYANAINGSTPTSGQTGMLVANQVSSTSISASSSQSSSASMATSTTYRSSSASGSPSSSTSIGSQNQTSASGGFSRFASVQALCFAASAALAVSLGAAAL